MARTLGELTTEARTIFNETDANNSHVSNSELYVWANEAYRYILTKTKDLPKQETDLTAATGDISVSTSTLTVDEAYLLHPTTGDYYNLEVVDLSYLKNISGSWLSTDADEPKYLVRKDTFSFYLYPQPSTDFVGQNIRTYGLQFPADMTTSSDTPSKLPINLQDALPHYMAYRAFSKLEQQARAITELELFRSMVRGQIDISTVGSNSGQTWRVTETLEDY